MSKYGMSKDNKIALMLVAAHLGDTFADAESERLADAVRGINATIAELAEALELADCALSGSNMNMNVVQRKVRAALEKATINA